jgi:hypothetical protein
MLFANPDKTISTGSQAYVEGSTIDVLGSLSVTASLTAKIDTGTLGVGVSTGDSSNSKLAGGGSVSINQINESDEAYITNVAATMSTPAIPSSVTASSVTVQATDTSQIISVAGGVAFSTKSPAVGAAISYNLIQNTITAFIEGTTVDAMGALLVAASSSPLLVAIAVGAAGSGTSFTLGGSITVNSIANDVDAHIADSAVSEAGSVEVEAAESGVMAVVAGGIAVSLGGAAVGAAFAYNYVGGGFDPANPNVINKSSAATDQISATITNSSVNSSGDIDVLADFGAPPAALPGSNFPINLSLESFKLPVAINSQLISVTVGGSGADGFALGGSVNLNFVRDSVNASISNTPAGDKVQAGGNVLVSATDSSTINAGAGALAISISAAAVGASISVNDISNKITASIAGADVSGATVTVNAAEAASINNLTAAGSGAADAAISGSITVNLIENTVNANIAGGSVVSGTSGVFVTSSDTSTIMSLSGQGAVALAGVGVGVALAYNEISNTVEAYIDGSSTQVTASAGNVDVWATATPTIESASGGIAIGSAAGIAGSISISLLTGTDKAYINAATVTAGGSVYVLAETNDTLKTYAGTISGGGTVGAGGSVSFDYLGNKTLAWVGGGASVSAQGTAGTIPVDQWATDTKGTLSQQQVAGLAVIASDDETIGNIATTAAVSGGVGLAANLVINLYSDTTNAYIAGSSINTAASHGAGVYVRAHRGTAVTSGGAAVAGALNAAVGVVVDTEIDNSTTSAFINQSTVYAGAQGVEVSAITRETWNSGIAGVSGGLYAGLAGGAVAVSVGGATLAYINGGSSVNSDGGLTVLANSGITTNLFSGEAGGGAVGIGGSVAVVLISHVTAASIDSSSTTINSDGTSTKNGDSPAGGQTSTNAKGTTNVEADSTETVAPIAISAGAGIAGIGLTVVVVDLTASTSATVVGAQVNQNSAYANPTQTVTVQATDTTKITDIVGSLGAGLGSFGIGIDVIQAKDVVDAHIAGTSNVSAGGSVSVTATGSNTIQSTPFSFSLGALVAANATVSDINIGSGIDTTGAGQLNGVQSTVNQNIKPSQFASGMDGSATPGPDPINTGSEARTDVSNISTNINDAFSSTGPMGDTEAYISGSTTVSAGGGVTVQATETLPSVSALVGQATGGALSLGGSVSVINVNSATLAYIDNGVKVSAGATVNVSAGLTDNVNSQVYAGHGRLRGHRGAGRLHHRQRGGGRLHRLEQLDCSGSGHHGSRQCAGLGHGEPYRRGTGGRGHHRRRRGRCRGVAGDPGRLDHRLDRQQRADRPASGCDGRRRVGDGKLDRQRDGQHHVRGRRPGRRRRQ